MSRGINAIPLVLLLALPLFGNPATVTGTVTLGGNPLPGCWVILQSKSVSRRTATDANGAFRFASVAPRTYDVKYEFSDFVPARQKFEVVEGKNEVPAQELTIAPFEFHGYDCTLPCAIGREPVWPSDRPSCADYDFNDALIEGVKHGDRSAIELLRQRYDKTFATDERRRIGHALLRQVEDDSVYWHELIASAENAVRYPSDHDPIALESLRIAAADPRSHALMIEALASEDAEVVALGIESLGRHGERPSPSAAPGNPATQQPSNPPIPTDF